MVLHLQAPVTAWLRRYPTTADAPADSDLLESRPGRLLGLGDDGRVEEHVRDLIEAGWESNLGVDRSLLRVGGVHVIATDVGDNDAMSFLLSDTCLVAVPDHRLDRARDVFSDLDAASVFTADALRTLLGADARVDGPSVHCYADEQSFNGRSDPAAVPVRGDDQALRDFLHANSLDDWAESGFPREPAAADPNATRFWVLRHDDEVVAAGNMTEWRGLPADVGVLTEPGSRGHGFAGRLVGAMVSSALPAAVVVRDRALATNTASLAVARRLGFETYGQNYRARTAGR